MPSDSSSSTSDFFEIAQRLSLLEPAQLERLRQVSVSDNSEPGQLAVLQGLMSADELDSVQILQRPTEAIPGYEILDLLGRGGMGVVFKARQQNLNRIVALKTISISRMMDATDVARFEREARTLAQLQHPHIVAVHDFGKQGGRVFLAMEYVEGTNVETMVSEQGPFAEQSAWSLARQVAAGLAHASRTGIVHRDIKPANLLLVEPPEGFPLPAGLPMVKVADFGLALLTQAADVEKTRLTGDAITVGSPQYMAPEQFHGSQVDLRADIYSLGVVVHQMLTTRTPFDGMDLPQIVGAKLGEQPVVLANERTGLNERTYELAARMTAKSPDDRPADYTELLQLIDELLSRLGPSSVSLPVHFHPVAGDTTPANVGLNTQPAIRPTEAMPAGAKETDHWKRPLIIVAALAGMMVAALAYTYWPGGGSSVPARAPMQEAGWGQFIFDGQDIVDWPIRSGTWNVPAGKPVISGTNGVLERTLFKSVDGRPVGLESYRLQLIVQLHEAEAAEVHFGLEPVQGRDGARYVIRIDGGGSVVGERHSDNAVFLPLGEIVPAATSGDRAHGILIERQPGGWFVEVDGREVAALPLREGGELPEFRLRAEAGTAFFSDVEVVELKAVGL